MHTKQDLSVGVLWRIFEAGSLYQVRCLSREHGRDEGSQVFTGELGQPGFITPAAWEMHADLCPATQPSLHKAQEHTLGETHRITNRYSVSARAPHPWTRGQWGVTDTKTRLRGRVITWFLRGSCRPSLLTPLPACPRAPAWEGTARGPHSLTNCGKLLLSKYFLNHFLKLQYS